LNLPNKNLEQSSINAAYRPTLCGFASTFKPIMSSFFKFSQWPSFCAGEITQFVADRPMEWLVTDSRKAIASETAVFFAMKGVRHDGHEHIEELYRKGMRQFVIERPISPNAFPEANFFLTHSSGRALQEIAARHRKRFSIPVLAITGSNGKTIVKEWLFQLLSRDFHTAKNPGSYNSQIGVPLSVWTLQPHHQLGIFEAGISQPNEMAHLAHVIQPTVGLITNLGSAHDEGFSGRAQKLQEKLNLFETCEALIYCADQPDVAAAIEARFRGLQRLFSWGYQTASTVKIRVQGHLAHVAFDDSEIEVRLPFADSASRENLFHCLTVMLFLGIPLTEVPDRLRELTAVPMRLELKQGIQRCLVVDDSYNNDLAGLQISLEFLKSQPRTKKSIILSDVEQSGLSGDELAARLNRLLRGVDWHRIVAVGPVLFAHQALLREGFPNCLFFATTEEFLRGFDFTVFDQEAILVKGARSFQFERVVQRLQQKIHGTVMEINLAALVNNLNYFKSRLKPGVKIMAMVKAFAYGSGSEQVAHLLQYHRVDYLGVAYADEGVELRKNGISLPIMVMNPAEESFETLVRYELEPEIYSPRLLAALLSFLDGRPASIHLKVDTGMHRLGFDAASWSAALRVLAAHPEIRVVSVMSHLAGADESRHDAFTQRQAHAFAAYYQQLSDTLGVRPIRHLLNSPGILRFPDYQFEMVRLGIGLYGINPTAEQVGALQPVATLKTIVSQIKHIPKGDTIGYGRHGLATEDMQLATIAIGYADGFSRAFSQGRGQVWINGKKAPVMGNVCMDMTMVDVTNIPVREGDEVIVFGGPLPIEEVAANGRTIAYEILTNTSERVKRVFYAESL
jgi:alanine racemase